MTDPRRPADRSGDEPGVDPDLEARLRSWLHAEPDRPSDTLAVTAMSRARETTQRPGWLARLRQPQPSAGRRLGRAGAAAASLAAAVLVLGVVWQVALNPIDNGASLSPTQLATPTPTASPSGPTGSVSTPFDGRGETMLALERRATALGSGFGSLWVGDEAGRLLRIDPSGARVIATVELGGVPCGPILAAATSVWLATCGDGVTTASAVTVRVDPATNTVVDRYDDGAGDGFGVSAMNGLVWFISDVATGKLTAVDAISGDHVRDLTLGTPIRHLTAGFGSLWVSPIGRPAVLRIDPVTGAELAAVGLSGDAGFLATSGDAIWVTEPHQWIVGRIDPVADRVSAELGASPGVDHLAIAESGPVWALADAEAIAFDPIQNREIDRISRFPPTWRSMPSPPTSSPSWTMSCGSPTGHRWCASARPAADPLLLNAAPERRPFHAETVRYCAVQGREYRMPHVRVRSMSRLATVSASAMLVLAACSPAASSPAVTGQPTLATTAAPTAAGCADRRLGRRPRDGRGGRCARRLRDGWNHLR